LEKTKIIF